jgi:hypothetical protein
MERARLLRLSQDAIARYSTVNAAVISRGRNYGTYVELADYRKIERFIDDAEELTRRAGAPLDWKDSASVDRLLKALRDEKVNPPPLPSAHDWELLQLVSTPGITPTEIAAHFGITFTELSQQMAEASKRFDHSANKLAARNADITALSQESVAYMDGKLKERQ